MLTCEREREFIEFNVDAEPVGELEDIPNDMEFREAVAKTAAEAVVTVNLTSLLVLTTLFISVSGSLPKTAYIKMIDVWLIFGQLIPWMEVLLHTAIDIQRIDEDEKGREINHHGRTISVGGGNTTNTKIVQVIHLYSTPLYFTVVHSIVQYGIVLYSTTLYCTLLHFSVH